jgi:hypothetical protein
MNEVPETLDWVTKLSRCSLSAIFEKLKTEIQTDCEIKNSLKDSPYHFSTNDSGTVFNVYRDGGRKRQFVFLKLINDKIAVHDQQHIPQFEITVSLNDAGECKPKVNGQERELWQVRRMALEKLFFENEPVWG